MPRALQGCERQRNAADPVTWRIPHRRIWGPTPRDARTAQRSFERLERMGERVGDRSPFEAAVRHAIVTARVAPHAVALPVRILHQGAIAGSAAFVGEQVARPLPAEDVVGGIAPGRALIGLVAGEKI